MNERARITAGEDVETSEPGIARLLQQPHTRRRIRREHGGCARTQRGGNRPLRPWFDDEIGEREPLALLRERSSGGREALLLGEHAFDRLHPLACESRSLFELVALTSCLTGDPDGVERRALELGRVVFTIRLGRQCLSLVAQALEQRPDGLSPERESLGSASKAVERSERSLATARCIRELLLGATAIGEQSLEPSLHAPTDECGAVAAPLGIDPPFTGSREVQLGDPCAQCSDLARELLGPFGGRRLESKRPEALTHLLLDIARSLHLHRDAGEPKLRAVAPALELAEAGGLLDERTPVLRLRREHLLDLALADDRVHRRTKADVREQLDEIGSPDRSAVHQVLPLGATNESTHDRHLAEIELRERTGFVVEDELDLAVLSGLAIPSAREEHVVGLLGAELRRRERPRRPDNGVGDVRLARAVRADDHGHARLERDLERVRKRLEAADADRLQMHRGGILTIAADGAEASLRATLDASFSTV